MLTLQNLLADPRNPRAITAEAADGLRASVSTFGDIAGLTWNQRTGQMVAGHQRLNALKTEATRRGVSLRMDGETIVLPAGAKPEEAEQRFSVRVVDWTDQQQAAANLTANNPAIGGMFTEGLGAMLAEVESALPDLFADTRLAELKAEAERLTKEVVGGTGGEGEEPPEPQTDRAAELAEKWGTAQGQVWEVPSLTVPGRCHRVMCGDCRNPDDVARLLDGARVNVAFTSPPYASQRKYDEESGFRPIRPDDYVGWFQAVQENVKSHLAPDGSWFVNIKEHCEDGQRHLYVKDLTIAHVRKWGWRFVDEFCWRNTANGVPGTWPDRFKNAWEPVFHFSVQACKLRADNVKHASTGTFEYGEREDSISGTPFMRGGAHKDGLALPSNVLEMRPESAGVHSAPFPVTLPAFFVKAYSDPGDIIFDPFLGSGTTTVAAEREGRIGYGTELSPKYLGVILQRLADMGLEPRRVS